MSDALSGCGSDTSIAAGRWHAVPVEEQAVVLDLDLTWDEGADPHLLAHGRKAFMLLLPVSPPGQEPGRVIPGEQFAFVEMPHAIIDFPGFTAVRAFGGPGTDTLATHHLYGKGLLPCHAHRVINSQWIAYEDRVDPVVPAFAGRPRSTLSDCLRHYLFTFSDEVLEFLAEDIIVERRVATQAEMLTDLGHRLLEW
jgi:hypothetical protein